MNYRETDELAAEIGFNSFECDSEIAEKVTIDIIKAERSKNNALIRNSTGIQRGSGVS